jgi:hypothetical protein
MRLGSLFEANKGDADERGTGVGVHTGTDVDLHTVTLLDRDSGHLEVLDLLPL